MDFLLLFVGEGVRLSRSEVKRALEDIQGIHRLEERAFAGAVLQAHFDYHSDSTIVRLKDDEETVSISGSGDASLKLALELQARLSVPLRLVDSDYSFDVLLQAVGSLEDLRRVTRGG